MPRIGKNVREEAVGSTETAGVYVRALNVRTLLSIYIRKLQVKESSKNHEYYGPYQYKFIYDADGEND